MKISIRKSTGEPIKFGNDLANVIIKLHFRKRESDLYKFKFKKFNN